VHGVEGLQVTDAAVTHLVGTNIDRSRSIERSTSATNTSTG